jgi:hypothetical protein
MEIGLDYLPKYTITVIIIIIIIIIGKMDTATPVQVWSGPEGSRRLRLPHFKTFGS